MNLFQISLIIMAFMAMIYGIIYGVRQVEKENRNNRLRDKIKKM